jgi:hypothetical protein
MSHGATLALRRPACLRPLLHRWPRPLGDNRLGGGRPLSAARSDGGTWIRGADLAPSPSVTSSCAPATADTGFVRPRHHAPRRVRFFAGGASTRHRRPRRSRRRLASATRRNVDGDLGVEQSLDLGLVGFLLARRCACGRSASASNVIGAGATPSVSVAGAPSSTRPT